MSYDVTIMLENQSGQLASMGEILGEAGINIEGMCGFLVEGKDCNSFLMCALIVSF